MHVVPDGPDRCTETRNVRGPSPWRGRLEALERENRELRRANESLLAALEDVIRRTQTVPDPPRPGTASAVDAPVFPPMEASARPDRACQWKTALEHEAPWETVLVPRGTSR